jgi:hypothetical protein
MKYDQSGYDSGRGAAGRRQQFDYLERDFSPTQTAIFKMSKSC